MKKDSGTLFPKKPRKKKRKTHGESIMQVADGRCYLCMVLNTNNRIHRIIHKHHVFGGPLRKISETYGFTVYLCLEHHVNGPDAVHNNHENMRLLQKICQGIYERDHTREQWMELVGRNYLEE